MAPLGYVDRATRLDLLNVAVDDLALLLDLADVVVATRLAHHALLRSTISGIHKSTALGSRGDGL